MEFQNENTRIQLLERFVTLVNFWAESISLYTIDINSSVHYEPELASQIRGLWDSCLGRILTLLNYRSTALDFVKESNNHTVLSYFASTCVLVSLDCNDNHSSILRDIARILFRLSIRQN